MAKIGERIREVREKRNFTQEYMADELNITPNGYGKIERGESSVNFDKLQKIAEILKVKLNDLIDLGGTNTSFDYSDSKIDNNTNNIANTNIVIRDISDKERELYEAQIAQLKEENLYLRNLVEKLAPK
jgi:transcriptional regulator with XRE-family HTH domain